ncbi:hypothetical protein [Flagellimonas nanhaiensis]|uniref:Uncharacterized protein n=1 Tax=Flagellimonas nanhaiensis TaxID=2292706 RepID=A0A371JT32_9FLAO|nr:hypothetical protein [Allomuricauda nanhaiensis]RDY60954.1 hypothetical protein DX873_01895 [Allomuricauda nanhaiensis]
MNYIETISKLSIPTQEQINRFTAYLLDIHSWYKHIPLIKGSVFTVYIEPDLNREYPTNHPKLPFGNTKEGYQQAFGHLSYQYYIGQICYQDFRYKFIDGKRVELGVTKIPEAYKLKWSIKLFPYCHIDFEEGISLFEEDIRILQNNGLHPQKDLLLTWYKSISKRNDYWNKKLNDEEREYLVLLDDHREIKEENDIPKRIFDYIKLERSVWDIEDRLRSIEEQKLSNSLKKLIDDFVTIKEQFANKE